MIQKAKIVTLILFGLLFIHLSAQQDEFSNDKAAKLPDDERPFRFGLQFNPNASWFKSNTNDYKSGGADMGFSYGLSFEYFMTKNYLFSTGLFMLNASGKLNYTSTVSRLSQNYTADIEAQYNLKYIEIPLMIKLRTHEIGYLTYFGQFGLTTGFNFGSSADFDYSYEDAQSSIIAYHSESVRSISQDVNWLNIALVIGVGIEYNISGNTSLLLGLTYHNGFINQMDTKLNEFDANGNALFDNEGNPMYLDKEVSANLNYIALNIGIFF